jgi:hypothetical protein
VIALLSALLLTVHPWPVGPGPRYQPPAGAHSGPGLVCGPEKPSFRVHLELFAGRKVVVLPAAIGVGSGCVYPLSTVGPDGVISVARGGTLTVGDLFRVWGQPLGVHSLAGFASSTPVRAYVAGRRVTGPVAAIRLTPHAQIVLELGGYVPPHPFFLFPGGSS